MRPRIRLIIPALVMALIAGACGGDDDDDDGGSAQTPTTQAEQPVRGGTLVIALESDPGSLNPAVTSSGGVHNAAEPMFNGLVGFDKDGKFAPELAERWEILENGAVYRFTLRENMKWHDGQPVTADDVPGLSFSASAGPTRPCWPS
ncbi:MAG: ABC transporter substrate-binding protein [Actinobacteria bacterium]|nr:ABC transporter substrate-binding protein [Actinomycetota bacterium]